MKATSNPKSSSVPFASSYKPSAKASASRASSSKSTSHKPAATAQKPFSSGAAVSQPKAKAYAAAPAGPQITLKQDRVTLIAFYTLFGSVIAGVIYFLALLFIM